MPILYTLVRNLILNFENLMYYKVNDYYDAEANMAIRKNKFTHMRVFLNESHYFWCSYETHYYNIDWNSSKFVILFLRQLWNQILPKYVCTYIITIYNIRLDLLTRFFIKKIVYRCTFLYHKWKNSQGTNILVSIFTKLHNILWNKKYQDHYKNWSSWRSSSKKSVTLTSK